MPWIARRLRDAKVFAACLPSGELAVGPDQRVDVLYRSGGKLYRASAKNLAEDEDTRVYSDEEVHPADESAEPAASAPSAKTPSAAKSSLSASGASAAKEPHLRQAAAGDAVHIYTDGACTGNPGPMGLGVVLLDPSGENGKPIRRELSEYLGTGTNNIAELTAILRALQIADSRRPVVIYTDSSYSIGILSQGWKAKANQELVAELRALLKTFVRVRFVKVAGHAGVPENERCDELARQAVARRA